MESRDSSHSRERSAEKTEKSHKSSKKKYVGNPVAFRSAFRVSAGKVGDNLACMWLYTCDITAAVV